MKHGFAPGDAPIGGVDQFASYKADSDREPGRPTRPREISSVDAPAVRWLPPVCASVAAAIGVFVLSRWFLVGPRPAIFGGGIPMAPTTAILVILFALAVGTRIRASESVARTWAYVTSGVALVVTAGVALQQFAGVNLVWDTWLAMPPDPAIGDRGIGHVSILTAGIAVILALAFLPAARPRGAGTRLTLTAQVAVAVCTVFSATIALAYMAGIPLFYGHGIVPMAFSTSVALTLIGVAALSFESLPSFFGRTLESRLLIGFAAVVTLLLFVVGMAYVGLVRLADSQETVVTDIFANTRGLTQLRANSNAERLDVAIMLDQPRSARTSWDADLEERMQDDLNILQQLAERHRHDPTTAMKLAELDAAVRTAQGFLKREVLDVLHDGDAASARAMFLGEQAQQYLRIHELSGELEAAESRKADTALVDTHRQFRSFVILFSGAGAVSLVASVLLGFSMRKTIAAYIAQRNRSEWELSRTSAFLRQTQDAIHLGGWEYDVLHQRLAWSPEVYRIHDLEPTDVPCDLQRAVDFYEGESRSKIAHAVERAVRDGEAFDLELEMRTARNRLIWVRAVGQADRVGDRIARVFGSVIDITERKNAEKALARSSAYNRSLIEASLDPLVTIGADGKITDVNAATEIATGHSRLALIGTDFSDYFTDATMARQGYQQVFREGTVHDYPLELRHRDGHTIPVLYNASVYRDVDGAIIGVFAAARDVTAIQRNQRALEQANAYNRSLIEASLDPLVTIGTDGKITDVNAATEAATGYARGDLIGSDFSGYFTEPERARAGYEQVFNTGRVRDYPLDLRHRDGRVTSVLYNASVFRNPQGQVAGVFAAARDITERKAAEESVRRHTEELRRSNEELERFAYVASHDLQEPLRTVSSFSQLLANRYRTKLDRDADEFIAFIVGGAARMQTLINDLLAYSRVGTRGKPLVPTDVNAVVRSALANLETAIAESGAVISSDPLPTVLGDETQLVQVFQNLIGNAIKFRQRTIAPRIHVSARPRAHDYEFEVRDNGIGIDPQYFDRIFLIFQRLHAREEYPGTGIGLAICKKIVERHGGHIRVESQPGHGAAFIFTLPGEDKLSL